MVPRHKVTVNRDIITSGGLAVDVNADAAEERLTTLPHRTRHVTSIDCIVAYKDAATARFQINVLTTIPIKIIPLNKRVIHIAETDRLLRQCFAMPIIKIPDNTVISDIEITAAASLERPAAVITPRTVIHTDMRTQATLRRLVHRHPAVLRPL